LEREAYQRELEIYEKQKNAVKEELRKKLEEILKENQKVADMRSD
jgi:hypothetical protein